MNVEDTHLLKGRIVVLFTRGRAKPGGTGERVANHGQVDCSCGWSSGERVSLPEAGRIADREHPEGIKNHPNY